MVTSHVLHQPLVSHNVIIYRYILTQYCITTIEPEPQNLHYLHAKAKHYLYAPFLTGFHKQTKLIFGMHQMSSTCDGNCLFRALSNQLFDNQGKHFALRSMFIWLESLNRPVFTNYLLTVNEPDTDQHIQKMALPNVWGTHVEIIAAAMHLLPNSCLLHNKTKQ